jgi:hypothetical protein
VLLEDPGWEGGVYQFAAPTGLLLTHAYVLLVTGMHRSDLLLQFAKLITGNSRHTARLFFQGTANSFSQPQTE